MPNLKSTAVGFAVGIVSAATLAWALEVKIPPKITAKANLVVDEVGNALFGSTPGNVAVTNLPAVQQVQVTNFRPPARSDIDDLITVTVDYGEYPTPPFPTKVVYTAPAAGSRQAFVLHHVEPVGYFGQGINWKTSALPDDPYNYLSYITPHVLAPGESISPPDKIGGTRPTRPRAVDGGSGPRGHGRVWTTANRFSYTSLVARRASGPFQPPAWGEVTSFGQRLRLPQQRPPTARPRWLRV